MLQATVGQGGANRPEDVRLVQTWLNCWRFLEGRPPLKVDGRCGPGTAAAIRQFESRALGRKFPNERLDPASASARILQSLPPYLEGDLAEKLALTS